MIRTALRVILALLMIGALLALGLFVALNLGGATWAANRLLGRVNPYPGTTLRAARVSGNFFTGLQLRDVRLTTPDGQVAFGLESLGLAYDPRSLLGDDIVIREVRAVAPRVLLRKLPDSSWDLARRKPRNRPDRPDDWSASRGPRVEIQRLLVTRGTALVRFGVAASAPTVRVESLESEGREVTLTPGVRIGLATINFRFLPQGDSPGWTAVEARGSLEPGKLAIGRLSVRSAATSIEGHGTVPLPRNRQSLDLSLLDIHLAAPAVTFRDLSPLHQAFDREGGTVLTLDARGGAAGTAVRLDARLTDGGTAIADGFLSRPGATTTEYRGKATLRRFDPSLIALRPAGPERVNGDLRVDLRGPSADRMDGIASLRVDDARYASVHARRTVAEAKFTGGRGQLRFDGELGDIGVRAGGWLRPFDDVPSYDVTARLRRQAGGAGDVWLDRMLGRGGTQVSLHAAGRGIDPRRADLQAVATVVTGPGPRGLVDSGSVHGRLRGGIADVRGRIGATGGLIDFQGQIILGDELRYRIERGAISRLNLAALLGDTTASALNAAFRLEGRGTGKDAARARGSMSLGGSFYGSHELTGARADFALSAGTARLDAEASLGGGSVDLTATGRPFQPRPTLHVERFQVRHLDLAQLIPGVHVRSDLSGTGNVRASGRRLDDSELAGRLTLQPSRLDDEPIEGGDLDASLTRGQLTWRLALRAPAGAVTLAGNARPFDSAATWAVREGTFRDLELGRLLGVRGLRTRLAGSLRAEATGRKPELARVGVDLTLTPSTVNRAAIQSGRIQARLADGRLHLVGRLLGDGDSLTVDASSRPFEHRPPLRLVVQAGSSHLGALVDRDTLDAAGAARLTLEGELGPRDTMRLRGTISAGGRAGGVTLDSLRATVGLAGGMLDLDTLAVRSNVGQLAGAGRLALFGSGTATSNLKLTANLLDLAPVGTLLQVEGLGLDSGRVTALLTGPRDHPRVSLGLMASELTIGHRRVGTARASLEGELGADRSIAAAKGSLALDHLVTYSSRVNNLRVDGAYDGRELTLHGESRLDATTRAWMAARVYPGARERKVELDTLESRSESASWGLSHPVRITYGDRIRVDDFVFGSRGSRIALDGTLDRRGMQRFRATVDSLPLGWIADIVGVGTLEGSVDGALDIAGPAAAPHVTGNLAGVIRSRNKAVGSVRGQADWVAPRGLHLDLSVYHPKGDSMRVAGELPLALSLAVGDSSGGVVRRIPRGEFAMDVTAHQFPVDLLEPLLDPAVVNKLAGRLTVDAHARGDIESPALSGRIALADAKIRIPPLGATYEKGTVDATLAGTTVRLTRARIESGDGRLEASGTVQVQGSPVAGFDLQSTLHDFQLADGEELRSTASGTLRLRGTATAPALAGAVRLRNTDYYLQAKSLEQGAEPVELTAADLRVVERRFGVVVERPAGGQLSRWALDLDVELAGNNWLRRRTNPSIAVELAGKVEVRKARGESIRVFGAIQPLHGRSFVQLMGRRFDVRGGEVALQGPLDSAHITLHSEYRADSGSSAHATGVVITSEVAVDTGRLAVKLGSQPPMSTADIRSYLTTGRPAGTDPTLNSDQADVLTTGASIAVGAALGSVAGNAGQRLGLDVVQVLQDRQGGQTLVAGKYVSPPLYLGFRQPIVAGSDPNETQSAAETIEWEVEYAALRRALLNLQGAGSEFRVFLRLRQ